MILTLIFTSLISSSFASGPCGGAQVGFWTNPDGSRGGSVASTAKVQAGVFIAPGAQVCESAQVKAGAKILDQAIISGRAVISAGAEISGRAKVQGEAKIGGSNVATKIGGDALVEGSAMVTGNTQVISRAKVRGSSKVHNAIVCQASLIEGFDVVDSDYYCQTEDPEPAHPGELGMKTLLGVDSDRDGVRDDLEIWINEKFSNTPNRDMFNYRMAFKQFSTAKQTALKFKGDKNKVLEANAIGFDAFDCLRSIYVNKNSDYKNQYRQRQELNELREDFEVLFYNTKERIKAEISTRAHSHGEILRSANKTVNGCHFKVKE